MKTWRKIFFFLLISCFVFANSGFAMPCCNGEEEKSSVQAEVSCHTEKSDEASPTNMPQLSCEHCSLCMSMGFVYELPKSIKAVKIHEKVADFYAFSSQTASLKFFSPPKLSS